MNAITTCLSIFRKKETHLQRICAYDIQEHEKAFTIGLECQKAIKQSQTFNTRGNVFMNDPSNGALEEKLLQSNSILE